MVVLLVGRLLAFDGEALELRRLLVSLLSSAEGELVVRRRSYAVACASYSRVHRVVLSSGTILLFTIPFPHLHPFHHLPLAEDWVDGRLPQEALRSESRIGGIVGGHMCRRAVGREGFLSVLVVLGVKRRLSERVGEERLGSKRVCCCKRRRVLLGAVVGRVEGGLGGCPLLLAPLRGMLTALRVGDPSLLGRAP